MTAPISQASPLILASSSTYRADLLRRLGLPFITQAPGVDESPLPGEAPAHLAQRLASSKAQIVARQHPRQWVLGSDQVASLDGKALGKPGNAENAITQLQAFSNRSVIFHTAVALARDQDVLTALDTTTVRFRTLTLPEIQRYVAAEPAFDCAGSFKAEGLGITLFSAIESRDPTALVGLPLIAVRQLLAQAAFNLP
jgi:septum formation protein